MLLTWAFVIAATSRVASNPEIRVIWSNLLPRGKRFDQQGSYLEIWRYLGGVSVFAVTALAFVWVVWLCAGCLDPAWSGLWPRCLGGAPSAVEVGAVVTAALPGDGRGRQNLPTCGHSEVLV